MQRYCQRVQRKFTFNLSSAAISYAKILQASAKKIYFPFAECSYILCKDTKKAANRQAISSFFFYYSKLLNVYVMAIFQQGF